MTICSLNEIEVYSRRAARAVGMAWGVAEEAGRSVRCLAAMALPSVETLLKLLVNIDGGDYQTLRPQSVTKSITENSASHDWQAIENNPICPITAACAVSDLGELLCQKKVTIHRVLCPLLLLPLLLRAAQRYALVFEVCWQGATARGAAARGATARGAAARVLENALVITEDEQRALLCLAAPQVIVSTQKNVAASRNGTGELTGELNNSTGVIYKLAERKGVEVSDQDWCALQAYASRIYVSASEESRLRGAGAREDEN